ncbi:AMP-binding protein [Acuticoccus sp.]|uniref:AMP-binding protein n=1 Tax=Acuticoccus sp. TaxID=1904378 RepID=UPI003B52036E
MSGHSRPWSALLPQGVPHDFDPEPSTLTAMLADAVLRHAAQPAVEYYGETVTFEALGQRVAAAAVALRSAGLRRGERVALYLPNTPFHPVWFFAVLAAGGVVTHFSPLDAPRELQHKAADSGARLAITLSTPLFAERALALKAAGAMDEVVLCDDPISLRADDPVFGDGVRAHEFVAPHAGAAPDPAPVAPSDLALLQYTGGTTGVPKAAMLSHRNLTAAVAMYRAWFDNSPSTAGDTVTLTYSPLFHIMGLTTNLLRRVDEGGCVVLRQRFDAAEAVDTIERLKVTSFGGVPTLWIALTQLPNIEARDLSSLRYVASGGAPLSVELFRRVRSLTGLALRGGWGMTETSPAGTIVPDALPEDKLGTIGIPLPGIDLRIVALDEPSRALPAGEVGEIAIRGANVTEGYWQRPEETAAAFADGWLLTGDIGSMDEEGYFYIVDRKKDLIVSSGFNVYPLVIENAIAEHPSVDEVIVIGVPDDYRGEAAKAFIVRRAGTSSFTLDELAEFLAERIGRHEVPREIQFREELPRTAVGKPSRRTLRDEELARSKVASPA